MRISNQMSVFRYKAREKLKLKTCHTLPQTARSELVRDFLNFFFGLDRPEVSLRCSWPEMVQDFLFLWSWTDQFWSVDPWFQDELDSGFNIQFFWIVGPRIYRILYAQNRPGPQKKENWDHFGPGTTQRNFGPVQTKKIKKISDQLGPSGPRTRRSVDPCP